MPYIVEKIEDQFIDAISKPESWIARDHAYAGLFESNRELQAQHEERGNRLHTPDWKLIASFPSTLDDAIRFTRDGGFIKDKKAFYAWLKRNKEYAAYDIKFGQ